MGSFIIRALRPTDRAWVRQFITERWGAEVVVARGVVHRPEDLPGFVAEDGVTVVGLVTYRIDGEALEIVTLDSLRPGQGIGSALLAAVAEFGRREGVRRVWLVTTNDNLDGLRFYQRRGFVLVAVHRDAVTAARRIKPTIPRVGAFGIPIHDELELERPLG